MKKSNEIEHVQVKAPNIMQAEFGINGTAPYVQLRFGEKAINTMMTKMAAGTVAKGKKIREARDFNEDFRGAMHVSSEGWYGIPASAFRAALIDACRLVNFKMTMAKMSMFILPDGFDALDGTPLVRIDGNPEMCQHHVRNATGVADIRIRAMWRAWGCKLRVSYDADQFNLSDVTNLLARVGQQVGVGEGRPFSKNSVGMGWGTFRVN